MENNQELSEEQRLIIEKVKESIKEQMKEFNYNFSEEGIPVNHESLLARVRSAIMKNLKEHDKDKTMVTVIPRCLLEDGKLMLVSIQVVDCPEILNPVTGSDE